jgi:hypothetical protein
MYPHADGSANPRPCGFVTLIAEPPAIDEIKTEFFLLTGGQRLDGGMRPEAFCVNDLWHWRQLKVVQWQENPLWFEPFWPNKTAVVIRDIIHDVTELLQQMISMILAVLSRTHVLTSP